ncbi:MAG TPA: glycosyltransferase [Terriglobia bacterium]|nr:glycosyltransferase [Terriglobia bacterium]
MVNVHIGAAESSSLFAHEFKGETISPAEMERRVSEEDLMVVNPFFSRFMFGFRVPGRKICYVQDFRTFPVLDCGFDLYVSVSTLVHDFLEVVYGIDCTIIPPFIEVETLTAPPPWRERPLTVAMYVKEGEENRAAGDFLLRELSIHIPELKVDVLSKNVLEHRALVGRIAHNRYLMNVSLAEGFGLVPLEAMAVGTCVVGLDGLGGRDYLRPGDNSMTYGIKDIGKVIPALKDLTNDAGLSERLTHSGSATARSYTKERFVSSWQNLLQPFLGCPVIEGNVASAH